MNTANNEVQEVQEEKVGKFETFLVLAMFFITMTRVMYYIVKIILYFI